MTPVLSWDLLIIVFFSLVVAYSFIVGKEESVKIIVSTYIAAVAVQGLGNIIEKSIYASAEMFGTLGIPTDLSWLAKFKVVIFVAAIVFLAIRAGFEIQYKRNTDGWINVVMTGCIGFATAGLLLSSLLTFISGRPLLDANLATAPILTPLLNQSVLVWGLVQYQDLLFALPAFFLLGVGFLSSR